MAKYCTPENTACKPKAKRLLRLFKEVVDLLPTANAGSAYILRLRDNASEVERRRHLSAITNDDKQIYITNDMLSAYDRFILDLNYIRQHPDSRQDVVMKPGDVLIINQVNNNVKVSGQVYNPSISVYEPGKKMQYYVNRAGGYAPFSKKNNTLVIYPNGEARKVTKFLFFKHTPPVDAGSEVVVPKKTGKKRKRTHHFRDCCDYWQRCIACSGSGGTFKFH